MGAQTETGRSKWAPGRHNTFCLVASLSEKHHSSQAGLCPLGSSLLLLRTLWEFFLYEWSSNIWHNVCINDGKSTTFDGEPGEVSQAGGKSS